MQTIFLDECGYTGSRLSDPEQPVFVIATLHLSETECQALKTEYFATIKAAELKHSVISKRPTQKGLVLAFLKHIRERQGIVKLSHVHKLFALVNKMVDFIIEPAFYADGKDLYKKGYNIALSNVIYMGFQAANRLDDLRKVGKAFEGLVATRDRDSHDAFFKYWRKARFPKYLRGPASFFKYADERLSFEEIVEQLPNDLDIAVSLAIHHMAQWRAGIEGPMQLVHDHSSPMNKSRPVWDALMDPKLPPAEVGYDRRRMKFPIAVSKTIPAGSKDWAGLQIADVLAGALTRSMIWMMNGADESDRYGRETMAILGHMYSFPIWPRSGITPEELGTDGPDAADSLTHFNSIMKDRGLL